MNPQQNLGLQLCVETLDGKWDPFSPLFSELDICSPDVCQPPWKLEKGQEVHLLRGSKISALSFFSATCVFHSLHPQSKKKAIKKNVKGFSWLQIASDYSLKIISTFFFNLPLVFFKGRSINTKSAGIIGRTGPQSKQPFLVAFFKASGVLLRSVRAAGGKKKNHNRNKSTNQQESSRAPKSGGRRQCSGCFHCTWRTYLSSSDESFSQYIHLSVFMLHQQVGFFGTEVQISKIRKKIYMVWLLIMLLLW